MTSRFTTSLAVALCTCSRDRAIEQIGAEGSAGDATVDVSSTTAGSDPGASATSIGEEGGTTGSTSTGSSSDASTGEDNERPAFPEECYQPAASIEVAIAETPEGPFQVDEAWVGMDHCSSGPFAGGVPNADNRLHARIEIHDVDGELSAEVELIDCGDVRCLCPCE